MILKNYWKWLENNQKNSFMDGNNINVNIGLKGLDGSNVNILQSSTDPGYRSYIANNQLLKAELSVRVGNGDTPVTPQDYCLENDLTSSLSNISYQFSSSTDNNITRIISFSGNNLTNNVLTINKVAIVKGIWSVPSGFSKSDVMMAIIELEEPIVVQPSDNFNIVCKWLEQ